MTYTRKVTVHQTHIHFSTPRSFRGTFPTLLIWAQHPQSSAMKITQYKQNLKKNLGNYYPYYRINRKPFVQKPFTIVIAFKTVEISICCHFATYFSKWKYYAKIRKNLIFYLTRSTLNNCRSGRTFLATDDSS